MGARRVQSYLLRRYDWIPRVVKNDMSGLFFARILNPSRVLGASHLEEPVRRGAPGTARRGKLLCLRRGAKWLV